MGPVFIMKAVAEIEQMLKGYIPIKKAMWYSYDSGFKKKVDDKLRSLKPKPVQRDLWGMPEK